LELILLIFLMRFETLSMCHLKRFEKSPLVIFFVGIEWIPELCT